jgi:heme exporter protein B
MIKTMFHTEFILRLRYSNEWLYSIGFFILVVSLFPFAVTPDPILLEKIIPGGIWVAALLASLLSIDFVFFIDWEEGNLDQLLLSPYPLAFFISIKLMTQWLIAELPIILFIPFLSWLFHLSIAIQLALILGLVLGTPILILLGSLGAALSLGLRQQGILLSLLILPLALPVLIFGVIIVQQMQAGFSIVGPCAFLAGICILASLCLPFVIAGTLRMGLDD